MRQEFIYNLNEPYVIVYVEPKSNIWETNPVSSGVERTIVWLGLSKKDPVRILNLLMLMPLSEVGRNCDYVIGYAG